MDTVIDDVVLGVGEDSPAVKFHMAFAANVMLMLAPGGETRDMLGQSDVLGRWLPLNCRRLASHLNGICQLSPVFDGETLYDKQTECMGTPH